MDYNVPLVFIADAMVATSETVAAGSALYYRIRNTKIITFFALESKDRLLLLSFYIHYLLFPNLKSIAKTLKWVIKPDHFLHYIECRSSAESNYKDCI